MQQTGRLRILVAEDDAMIATLLGELLEGLGHDVCSIEASEAGLVSAALRERPDLMIVDANLGAGSGLAAIREVLRLEDIPYLLMSGGPVKMAPQDAVVLEKPFWESDLVRAIERALVAHVGE
jgi:CheY-like chemotaxis protein